MIGYCTRVIFLMFYLSCVVSIFGDTTVSPVDLRLAFILTGWGFILLGIALFLLTFIGDFIRYYKEKRI